jgi:transcriptional regulator with XRE-family HTH domain
MTSPQLWCKPRLASRLNGGVEIDARRLPPRSWRRTRLGSYIAWVTTTVNEPVGLLVRRWRERRRLSQLQLANEAGVSSRHLSFIETGRSQPSPSMILRLSEFLEVPLRERNTWLLAAGFAPTYSENDLSEVSMSAVSTAINQVLGAHEPFPSAVVDQHWDLVAANSAIDVFLDGCAPELLEPPVNVLRLSLHPRGMAPRITNLHQWKSHLMERLRHQVLVTDDADLRQLAEELEQYPHGSPHSRLARGEPAIVVPLHYQAGSQRLSFFSTTTVFGAPLDITVAELAIESFYPTDDATRRALTVAHDQRLA